MTRREEIEKAIKECKEDYVGLGRYLTTDDIADVFEEGAEWADKTMIDKACEWVENYIFDFPWYDNEQGDFSSKDVANALRKAMEE